MRTWRDWDSYMSKEIDLPPDRHFGPSNVFSIPRREADYVWDSVLYVRNYLTHFEETTIKGFWNNPGKSQLYVNGPPGCGKTCFFYLWARLFSVNERKHVLIVQFRGKQSCYIWIREGDGILWRLTEAIEAADLRSTVKKYLQWNMGFDLCILDGVLDGKAVCSSMLSTMNTAVSNGFLEKVVHATALAFSLSTGGQRLDSSGSILRLSLNSWRLQDYIEAIKSRDFTNLMIDSQGSKLR